MNWEREGNRVANGVRGGYRFRGQRFRLSRSDFLPIVSFRFVSDDAYGKIRFWSLEDRHRSIVIVFCIQAVECESESYSGEGIENLTAKVSGEDFDLVQRN